jgi:tubulin--tyrosine ligase-like protein 12
MDMIVTNNIDEIIRSVETGPKICQKYMSNPLLLRGKKFDLRFIIVLKKLVPLELYFYSKMFWVRSANKDFTIESSTFSDYETHFTVMNYNTFGMQTVYNHQFLEYLKEVGIDWEPIYAKIKKQMKDVFTLASKDCPQMNDCYSGSIYGLDIMIDEYLEPRVLEINYSPDCTRACKFVPEFYNDIFETLFLNKLSGVELV